VLHHRLGNRREHDPLEIDHHLCPFAVDEAVADVVGVRLTLGAAHQVDFVEVGEALNHVLRERIDARVDRALGVDRDVPPNHLEHKEFALLLVEDLLRDARGAARVGDRLELVVVGLQIA
jgi:hypothetical protein